MRSSVLPRPKRLTLLECIYAFYEPDMTYLQFHLVFTLPPLLLLAFLTYRAARQGRVPQAGLIALGVHVLLALVYTTPWDNLLVARGVWGYGENRVLFTLGWVPFEEYLFFVLQTLLTGLWVLLLYRGKTRRHVLNLRNRMHPLVRLVGALAWLGLASGGRPRAEHAARPLFRDDCSVGRADFGAAVGFWWRPAFTAAPCLNPRIFGTDTLFMVGRPLSVGSRYLVDFAGFVVKLSTIWLAGRRGALFSPDKLARRLWHHAGARAFLP